MTTAQRTAAAAAVVFLAYGSLQSQIQTVDQVRTWRLSARAAGMADAYASEVGDPGMLYWNPAAISFSDPFSASLDHYQQWSSSVANELLAIPVKLEGFGAVAFGAGVSHVGYVGRRPLGQPQGTQNTFDLGLAFVITDGLSIGARGGYRHGRGAGQVVTGATWSTGLTYHPGQDITYGIVFGESGEAMRYDSAGGFHAVRLPKRLQIGLTLRFPESKASRLLSIALGNEKWFGRRGLLYQIGLEVTPIRPLSLRGGYVVGPGVSEFRYGAGFRIGYVRIDGAASHDPHRPHFQQFTFSFIPGGG